MSDNTNQRGFTIVELLITIVVAGLLVGALLTVTFTFYGNTIRNSNEARLAVESQNILRSIVEELRISSGVRSSNQNGIAGEWTTSNASLVLIIASPALNSNGQFVTNSTTGERYINELVYYASGNKLYKRYIVPAGSVADGNRNQTSFTPGSGNYPEDVLLSSNFKSLSFVFYDQDNNVTTTLADARSIALTINMEQAAYGTSVKYNNTIRMTLRNYQL